MTVTPDSIPERSSLGKRIWGLAKILFAVAVIGWLYYSNREQLDHLRERQIHWWYFAAAFVAAFLAALLTFFRWYLLVRALNIPFTVWEAFRLGFLGLACNFVMPGQTGGDFVKAVLLAKDQSSRKFAAFATVFIDRILGLVALFAVGTLAGLWPTEITQSETMQRTMYVLWAGTAAGLLGMLLLMIPAVTNYWLIQSTRKWPVVGHVAGELLDAAALYQDQPGAVAFSLIISLGGHVGILSSFWLCGEAFKGDHIIPGFFAHLQFVPIAELAGVLNVFTPGGLGALEVVMQFYYAAPFQGGDPEVIKAADADGLITAIAYRMLTVLLGMIGLIFYFSAKQKGLLEHISDEPPPA